MGRSSIHVPWAVRLAMVGGLLVAFTPVASAEDQRTPTVGMPASIDQLVLPGGELKARPLDDRRLPIVLRIAGAYPHGTAFRYDLVYHGLEPGSFDLKDYLVRADGSPTNDVPAIMVEIRPLLPPGQIEPNELNSGGLPRLGGYRSVMIVAAVAWLLGAWAILLLGRRRRPVAAMGAKKTLSLAERLRPAVEKAVAGHLTEADKSELERLLLAYWRKQLKLEDARPADAMAALRANPESARLLEQLETWLHRPAPTDKIDLAELLRPYETIPAEVGQ